MGEHTYWSDDDLIAAEYADSFRELGVVALRVLRAFPQSARGKIAQVCGPITIGGFNSPKINFLVMRTAVSLLRARGQYVFDQTPLERSVVRLWQTWRMLPGNEKRYCWPILEEVYDPLFNSGMIGTLYFLPGWEYSVGSCWERSRGLALRLKIHPYPPKLYRQILVMHGLCGKRRSD